MPTPLYSAEHVLARPLLELARPTACDWTIYESGCNRWREERLDLGCWAEILTVTFDKCLRRIVVLLGSDLLNCIDSAQAGQATDDWPWEPMDHSFDKTGPKRIASPGRIHNTLRLSWGNSIFLALNHNRRSLLPASHDRDRYDPP